MKPTSFFKTFLLTSLSIPLSHAATRYYCNEAMNPWFHSDCLRAATELIGAQSGSDGGTYVPPAKVWRYEGACYVTLWTSDKAVYETKNLFATVEELIGHCQFGDFVYDNGARMTIAGHSGWGRKRDSRVNGRSVTAAAGLLAREDRGEPAFYILNGTVPVYESTGSGSPPVDMPSPKTNNSITTSNTTTSTDTTHPSKRASNEILVEAFNGRGLFLNAPTFQASVHPQSSVLGQAIYDLTMNGLQTAINTGSSVTQVFGTAFANDPNNAAVALAVYMRPAKLRTWPATVTVLGFNTVAHLMSTAAWTMVNEGMTGAMWDVKWGDDYINFFVTMTQGTTRGWA